ncbi:F-box/WD repeat-containing protein 5 [Mactra antiquata]
MPLLCFEKRRSPVGHEGAEGNDDDDIYTSIWQDIPDSILLHVFSFLEVPDLGHVAQTCKTWHRVSLDESLWKVLLHSKLDVNNVPLADGKVTWYEEVKRVYHHVPTLLTEILTEHTDEVLHVSFSHNGQLFSTTSKDATLKVWKVGYPTQLLYSKDFRDSLSWDFTQFSSFNESDTMVLVSSVKSTHAMDRRGYMAILSLVHDFEVLRVVTMDPSQLFGAWLDDTTFLGGSLEISLDRFATTVQIQAHEVPEIFSPLPLRPSSPVVEESMGRPLFTFSSETASLIKFLTVANVTNNKSLISKNGENNRKMEPNSTVEESNSGNSSVLDLRMNIDPTIPDNSASGGISITRPSFESACDENIVISNLDARETVSPILCEHCGNSIKHKTCTCYKWNDSHTSNTSLPGDYKRPSTLPLSGIPPDNFGAKCKKKISSDNVERNLILVTGEFAVALHQIGFKNVPPYARESVLARGATPMDADNPDAFMVVNYSNNDVHIVNSQQQMDTPDHLIDLFGHVTGLCLTPDQRYLFINCRPWVGTIDRSDPWATPDLSSDIEIRIIDLHTLKDLGVRYKGHKGFSPPNMCCFVFLDVSHDYVASGSEDAKGYLWDRHYNSLLTKYEHEEGVVNAVGFSPSNQEYLVTVSDDKTIKVWRSQSEVNRLNINMACDQ